VESRFFKNGELSRNWRTEQKRRTELRSNKKQKSEQRKSTTGVRMGSDPTLSTFY